ncbi:MAG: hypothetical protein IJL52_04920 [Clostridia bacterium]|nr:hypothetical protein [Clostridia bacterium]
MKHSKKLLSVLLALLMLLSVGSTALAGEEAPNADATTQTEITQPDDAQPDDALPVYTLVTDESGLNSYWVDENGDRVSFSSSAAQTESGAKKAPAANLPRAYSSLDEGYTTPVENQMGAGACTSFAVTTTLETTAVKQGLIDRADAAFSPLQLQYFSRNTYTDNPDDPTAFVGTTLSMRDALRYGTNPSSVADAMARGTGPVSEVAFPFWEFYPDQQNPDESRRYQRDYYLRDYSEVLTHKYSDVTEQVYEARLPEIKQAIYEKGAVAATIGIYDYDHFRLSPIEYKGKKVMTYYTDYDRFASHMVALIGYDDDFPVECFPESCRPEKPGAFLAQNSWGADSGSTVDGYCWISYWEPTFCDFSTYELQDENDFDNLYQYDCDWANGGGAWGNDPDHRPDNANIYRAKNDELLTEVGITTSQNTVVRLWVYTELQDPNDPESGTLAYHTTQTYPYGGYHTIKLPQATELPAGTDFSIGVTCSVGDQFWTPQYKYVPEGSPVARCFERQRRGWVLNNNRLYSLKAMTINADHHTHVWDEGVEEPLNRCIRPAHTAYTCTVCGKKRYANVQSGGLHSYRVEGWNYIRHDEPTCASCGGDRYACAYCNMPVGTTFMNEIPALPHTYDDGVFVEGNCLTGGTLRYTCAVCKGTKDEPAAPAAAHLAVETINIAETCTEDGVSGKQVCRTCGTVLNEGTVLPACGHQWDAGVVTREATCSLYGEKYHVCQNDASHTYVEILPSLPHTWGEWYVVTEPTQDHGGLMMCDCQICGEHQYYGIPQLPQPQQQEEPPAKQLNFFQRLIAWLKNLFQKLFH